MVPALLLLLGIGDASAEICGRVTVFEPNLQSPAERGLGEVFVYAFEPGESSPATRFMAVSDPDGNFCIHDTEPGDWVVTAWEPFQFRPFVVEISCQDTPCDLGTIRVDASMVRISDDFLDYEEGWWGGPFSQSVQAPPGAQSAVKITFRSGAPGNNDVFAYLGDGPVGEPLATSTLSFAPNGGRGTAVFAPGELSFGEGEVLTFELGGGSAPWRNAGNPDSSGQMYSGADAVAGTDLCLTLDVDGPDGNLTSYVVAGENGWRDGGVLTQSFVARSESVTHASLFVGSPCVSCPIRASISDTVDGPPIGPAKESQGIEQQGIAFAWFGEEVPVTPGQTYFVRYEFLDGYGVAYARDGNLWGRVMGPAAMAAGDTGDSNDDRPVASQGPTGTSGSDAGDTVPTAASSGCGCSSADPSIPWWTLFVLMAFVTAGEWARRARPSRRAGCRSGTARREPEAERASSPCPL